LLQLTNSTLIADSGLPDEVNEHAREVPVAEVPSEYLSYLLNSRYCEVDRFSSIAYELFGHVAPGWDIVITARASAAEAEYGALEEDLRETFSRARLWRTEERGTA